MIVGLCGLAGSGKSTAAEYLIGRHGYRRGKFAGALKEMMRALLRYRGVDDATIERMIEGDLKESPSAHLGGKSPRHAMQTLGTEWGRDCIDVDYWVDTEMHVQRDTRKLVFDDVRHANEADSILDRGGVLITLKGRGGIAGKHGSEIEQPAESFTIDNVGNLTDLYEQLEGIVMLRPAA